MDNTQTILQEMIFNHSAQYGDFPDVVIIDLETSRRLKQEHHYTVGNELFDIKKVLDDQVSPSFFMGVPVLVYNASN